MLAGWLESKCHMFIIFNSMRKTLFSYDILGSPSQHSVSGKNKKTVDKWPKVCIYLSKGGGLSSLFSFSFFQFNKKSRSVAILTSAVFATLNIIIKMNWTRQCSKCWRHHIFFLNTKLKSLLNLIY